jgi:hypothetical protein
MQILIPVFTLLQIRILLLVKVIRICDHRSTDPPRLRFDTIKFNKMKTLPLTPPPWASKALHGSIFLSLYSSRILISMRIRIWVQFITLMRIRLPKIMLIGGDPDPRYRICAKVLFNVCSRRHYHKCLRVFLTYTLISARLMVRTVSVHE